MSDQVSEILEAPKEFVHDGMQFMKRCQKPDQKEFLKVSINLANLDLEALLTRILIDLASSRCGL